MCVKHLLVNVTAHGFGHVAQIAPVLNVLYRMQPAFKVTVRSGVPEAFLRTRIHGPFQYVSGSADIGMLMHSALEVDVAASHRAYLNFHARWHEHVMAEAQLLQDMQVDLLLSNVGYLALAGAQQAGIRNAALCSLNWADIYRFYCGDDAIAQQIYQCYAQAEVFFRTTPGMLMADLPNVVGIGPIADQGVNRRQQLNQILGLAECEKLGLISLGGIQSRLPVENWPRLENVRWIVQQNWQIQRPDVITLESLNMPFNDVLASCDVLVCKPGYGSFAEAACQRVPVLYVNRPDWPESAALTTWLQQVHVACEVDKEVLNQGAIAQALTTLWQQRPQKPPVSAHGAQQVATWLANALLD